MEQFTIEPLRAQKLGKSVRVTARAMVATPFPMAIFQPLERSERGMAAIFRGVPGRGPLWRSAGPGGDYASLGLTRAAAVSGRPGRRAYGSL